MTCLVVEPATIVLEDLATTIREIAAGATVLGATGEEAALAAIEGLHDLDVALVNLPPQGFSATPLGLALARLDAVVIFLGYEVEAQALGWRFLERPVLPLALAGILAALDDVPSPEAATLPRILEPDHPD